MHVHTYFIKPHASGLEPNLLLLGIKRFLAPFSEASGSEGMSTLES